CTGIIVRAPLCAPGQAQSPPQAKASAIRSWPVLDEPADTPAIKQGEHVVGLRVGLRRLLVVSIVRPDLRIRANVLSVGASARFGLLSFNSLTQCAARSARSPGMGEARQWLSPRGAQ